MEDLLPMSNRNEGQFVILKIPVGTFWKEEPPKGLNRMSPVDT
jgi:hypothetical protein